MLFVFFFFKQKTAYEMRISDWSSDVCSSDLRGRKPLLGMGERQVLHELLGTDPGPVGEHPLEMRFAEPDLGCRHCKARLVLVMRRQPFDGLSDGGICLL